MTGVENLLFIDWGGGMIWDRDDNFSKFIDRRSHRGASHRVLGLGVSPLNNIVLYNLVFPSKN